MITFSRILGLLICYNLEAQNLLGCTTVFLTECRMLMAQFLAYRHTFPIGQLSSLDSYITSDPFALGSLIALIMEAARTSETGRHSIKNTEVYP
jgi:hypothetical protein